MSVRLSGRHYLVLAMRKPGFDAAVGPRHRAFPDALEAGGRLAGTGPFADDLAQANAIAHRDPLHTKGASDPHRARMAAAPNAAL